MNYDPDANAMLKETMTEDRIPAKAIISFTENFSIEEFSHTKFQSARRAAVEGVLNGERKERRLGKRQLTMPLSIVQISGAEPWLCIALPPE